MYEVKILSAEERKYTFAQSHEIETMCGLVGYLRADFGSNGTEFWTNFFDTDAALKNEDFSGDLDTVINELRANGGLLSKRSAMMRWCNEHPEANYDTDGAGYDRESFGVRVDTEKYAFLMRLNPQKGAYNLYCYGYVREWLDSHIAKARKGISIRGKDYTELFRVADGDQIQLTYPDGEMRTKTVTVRFIDETHFLLDVETHANIYHMDQFAEMVEAQDLSVIPLRRSLPKHIYVFVKSEGKIGIVKKGEVGYYKTDITPMPTHAETQAMVADLNKQLGATPAQCAAMYAGYMFGWSCPAADPALYDAAGKPMKKGAVAC